MLTLQQSNSLATVKIQVTYHQLDKCEGRKRESPSLLSTTRRTYINTRAREAKSPRYAFKISLSYRSLSIESNGLHR